MRYFLRKEQRSELSLRCQYLYDVFKLWFIQTGEVGDFDVLESFPFVNDDIALIYGHNYEIVFLFKKYSTEMKEKNIAIISCETDVPKGYFLKNKKVFLAPQREGRAELLIGEDYGFEFDITDAELLLYNCRISETLEKISSVFHEIP